uniref:Rap1 GTPase-GDP dissociation stimulator 1 n=1 Tax=Sphaerodactylus townsendi TaxID=933632 RepID=A0ACB8E8H7_9SAUR
MQISFPQRQFCYVTPRLKNKCSDLDTETSEKIQKSGILQVFATLLTPQSSCTAKVANIIAEVAKNEFMRNSCVEAGLIPPLVQLLNCKDQEVLLQTGRALGNICYDSLLIFCKTSVDAVTIKLNLIDRLLEVMIFF